MYSYFRDTALVYLRSSPLSQRTGAGVRTGHFAQRRPANVGETVGDAFVIHLGSVTVRVVIEVPLAFDFFQIFHRTGNYGEWSNMSSYCGKIRLVENLIMKRQFEMPDMH